MSQEKDKWEKEIQSERDMQDRRFGEQNWDPIKWMCILTEELGETAQAANDAYDWKGGTWQYEKLGRYRAELIQTAAVAKAMLEALDRGKWSGN